MKGTVFGTFGCRRRKEPIALAARPVGAVAAVQPNRRSAGFTRTLQQLAANPNTVPSLSAAGRRCVERLLRRITCTMQTASIVDIRSALDTGAVVTRAQLRERGWTDSMIARLLGEPDMTLPNPRYRSAAPMRLYRRERVETIEASVEFAARREIGARRAERSKASASRRAANLVMKARAYIPSMPGLISYDSVLERAIHHYNEENLLRGRVAGRDSDPAFLARLAWNYVRHHLTDWDATWEGFSGKPGVRDAYLAAAASLTAHVCAQHPALCAAAGAWLERERSTREPP